MNVHDSMTLILFKAAVDTCLVIGGSFMTWFVGQRIIAYWEIKKKHRELDIAAAKEFQQLFGEFKKVGKQWRVVTDFSDQNIAPPQDVRRSLLDQAADGESKMEAILVKLATERFLTPRELDSLARFRQAHQQLRRCIRQNVPCAFTLFGPEYHMFHDLTCEVLNIIGSEPPRIPPPPEVAKKNVHTVVSLRPFEFKKIVSEYVLAHPDFQMVEGKESPYVRSNKGTPSLPIAETEIELRPSA